MTTVLDALQRAVDHYPGGRAAVAARLRKTDEVLRKELSGASTHKLGAVDAVAIARYCVEAGKDFAVDFAQAVASECGGRFEAGDVESPPTHTPVQKIAFLTRETADVTHCVLTAMADGVVSDNELADIEREISEAENVLRKLRQAARAVNAAGKPGGRAAANVHVRSMTSEAA